MNDLTPLTYDAYTRVADDCDIALWRPRGRLSWGSYIARYTGGPYSHVTGIVRWNEIDRWMSCGYEEGKGGFAEPLDAAVEKASGRIDVYRVSEEVWNKSKATHSCVARRLGQDTGGEYGWLNIWLIVAPLLPLIGFFTQRPTHEKWVERAAASKRAGICSQHVARSFAKCGIQLCKKPTALVTPNDLWNTAATEYVCTLVRNQP